MPIYHNAKLAKTTEARMPKNPKTQKPGPIFKGFKGWDFFPKIGQQADRCGTENINFETDKLILTKFGMAANLPTPATEKLKSKKQK